MTTLRPTDAVALVAVVAAIAVLLGFAAAGRPAPPPLAPISVSDARSFWSDDPLVIRGWLVRNRLCEERGCAGGPALELRGAPHVRPTSAVLVVGIVHAAHVTLVPLELHSQAARL